MTQEEFNAMLQVALAQGLPGGYYTSKYSGEEVDALLSGKGMSILGRYDTVYDIESPVDGGHYYIGTETPYHVFTYINGNWVDAGTMQGPQGDPGPKGDPGPRGPGPECVIVTLSASGWDSTSKTQTVSVSGVSANENAQLITPAPAVSSQKAYYDAGILCTGQAEDSLTFTCQTVPTEDLTVYIVIQEVSTA